MKRLLDALSSVPGWAYRPARFYIRIGGADREAPEELCYLLDKDNEAGSFAGHLKDVAEWTAAAVSEAELQTRSQLCPFVEVEVVSPLDHSLDLIDELRRAAVPTVFTPGAWDRYSSVWLPDSARAVGRPRTWARTPSLISSSSGQLASR